MSGMINCMRFKPKEGQDEKLFKELAKYFRDYPFGGIHHAIIDLGTGEYALVGVHSSVDDFVDIMNRDNRVSDLMRLYVEPYEDGESFHSFSGPEVDLTLYLQPNLVGNSSKHLEKVRAIDFWHTFRQENLLFAAKEKLNFFNWQILIVEITI